MKIEWKEGKYIYHSCYQDNLYHGYINNLSKYTIYKVTRLSFESHNYLEKIIFYKLYSFKDNRKIGKFNILNEAKTFAEQHYKAKNDK